jgi:hypothetical protein
MHKRHGDRIGERGNERKILRGTRTKDKHIKRDRTNGTERK